MVITALLVLLGGGTGAVARFVVDGLVQLPRLGEFPTGTFVVNVGGCLILGLLTGLDPSHRTTLVLGTATVGSYTTFSTWMLESQRLAEEGELPRAFANLMVSLLLGLVVVYAGRELGLRL